MANNVSVKDSAAADQVFKTTDTAGVHTPHHNVDASALPTGAATSAKQDTQITAEQAIQTAVEILDNVVSGSEAQVDVVAALPAGTNNIGDVDVLSVVPGTGATNLGKAIDTATGGTDTGVLALATRDDALGALTPIEGDNVQLRVDANGALWTRDDVLEAALSGSELQVDVVGALPAGANAIGKLAANSGVDIGDVDILSIAAGDNNIGNVDVVTLPALAAGTNNIGDVDVLSVVPGTGATALGKAEDAAHSSSDTGVYALAVRDDAPAAHSGADGDYESLHVAAEGGLWVTPTPSAQGGLSIARDLDLDETELEIKASAGQLYGWYIYNDGAADVSVKLYNATAANVTVGTTTPVMTLTIPAGSAANVEFGHGIAFSTAICAAAVTEIADNGTTAPAANQVVANFFYK